jgi:hypothetical protein
MRILVACERSGIVREAFRRRGHDAWSCDLVPAVDGSRFHLQHSVLTVLRDGWDAMIAFPECRFMANSGVLRLYIGGKKVNGRDEARWQAMLAATDFFRKLLHAPIPRIAIENPVMHCYAKAIIGVNPAQSIQPYQFGEDASKRTCLWLVGFPKLKSTKYFPPRIVNGKKLWSNQTDSGQNRLGPSPNRPILRATTYPGIADAMAEQWG